MAEFGAGVDPDDDAERDAGEHPEARPECGFFGFDFVGGAVCDEVDGEHDQDECEDAQPHPEFDVQQTPY